MKDYTVEDERDPSEEELLEEGEIDSTEEGFLKGYSEDDAVLECEECGAAIREEKKLVKEINSEEHTFCSKACSQEYVESLAEE